LERGCVGTIGKEHFTYLYSPARTQAFTSRNIRAGWAKAGLFPFNPEKVLNDIPRPLDELTAPKLNELQVEPNTRDQVPQTPATPVSAEALTSLLDIIKQVPDDEENREHKARLQQKHTNATRLLLAKYALLDEQNRFLAQINNEAKPRRSVKSDVLGTARVLSYEDLERLGEERAAKERDKANKKTEREMKKVQREAKKAAKEAEIATMGKRARGRKRKQPAAAAVDAPEPAAKVPRMSELSELVRLRTDWLGEEQQIAPVARMI